MHNLKEIRVKERQKIQGEAIPRDIRNIDDYCRSLKYN